MFGDVFLCEATAERVFALRPSHLTWIGRTGGTRVKKWGERFGAWIPLAARRELGKVCKSIRRDYGLVRGPRASA